MRHVLAVASVIVVAMGLGGLSASMSVDLTPPGLDFFRPQEASVTARIETQEQQRTIQAEISQGGGNPCGSRRCNFDGLGEPVQLARVLQTSGCIGVG
jgi:hypothetical protein